MSKLKKKERDKVLVDISKEIKNIESDYFLGIMIGYTKRLKEESMNKPKLKTG